MTCEWMDTFWLQDYGMVESEPLLIYACDLGPKHQGSGPFKWHKSYSKSYIWGQLISWFRQTSADPGASLVQDRRGCLMLPDVSSCYARTIQHDFRCGYSEKDRKKMIFHMVSYPKYSSMFITLGWWLVIISCVTTRLFLADDVIIFLDVVFLR